MDLHLQFTPADWLVLFGYLALTTFVGHLMRGHQASIRDFFLGGRTLPWPAVTGSIIATEISGVTFVGVPGMVFAAGGDFTYLQWAIGSVVARGLIGLFFVKAYYEHEIYSPYDFMGIRLGPAIKKTATGLFWLGSILGQSVRVLVAALALRVILPEWIHFEYCIVLIGVFAILWTLMGGMRTVIWTDVMQFFLFTVGGTVALTWIIGSLPGGWGEFWRIGSGGGGIESLWTSPAEGVENKFRTFDLTTDPAVGFTLWVAILAVPFLNLSAFGVDQLNAQRMFCCRSARDARKAIVWSSVGQLLTLLMLLVGAGLYVYYAQHGLPAQEAALFAEDNDYVFPVWITTTLPVGLRGLILAGVFAAAISSLDSILAALSQTTLSLIRDRKAGRDAGNADAGTTPDHDPEEEAREGRRGVRASRLLVVGWGVLLTAFAIALNQMRDGINMVNLAFGMVSYTTGPMLGLFLAALFRLHRAVPGLVVGTILSILLVLWVRMDLFSALIDAGWMTAEQVAAIAPAKVVGEGQIAGTLHFAWMYPATTFLTLGAGWIAHRARRDR